MAKLVVGGTCVHKHALCENNIYRYPNGRIVCKVCRANSQRKYKGRPLLMTDSVGAWNKNKTHCPAGHEYNEANTRIKTDGSRSCKICTYARNRKKLIEGYGISVADYDQLLIEQSGRCAVCVEPLLDPHIDHDHKTQRVRGLLCNSCNNGLGRFQDNIQYLQNAVAYLQGIAETN